MDDIELRFRLAEGAVTPHYASAAAAGLDLEANLEQPVVLRSGSRAAIPTGLFLEIPPGYEGQVRPRSGLARDHGITVMNAPGTIDADYRGEIIVLLINTGGGDVVIRDGMRIAQLVLAPVIRPRLVFVTQLSETARGAGGFGSTGVGSLPAVSEAQPDPAPVDPVPADAPVADAPVDLSTH